MLVILNYYFVFILFAIAALHLFTVLPCIPIVLTIYV